MTAAGQDKPSRGDRMRLKADFVGVMVDMAKAFQESRLPQGATDTSDLSPSSLQVRNESGQRLGRFNVVCFDEPTRGADSDEFKNQLILKGIEPEAGKLHKFGITIEGGDEGAIVDVLATGCVQVRIDVTSEGHEYAQAKAGDVTQLESCGYGPAEILWREGSTGEQWAIVRLGPVARETRWVKCTTTDDVPAYPTAGNIMPVEFGEYAISGSLLSQVGTYVSPSWASYSTPLYGLAVDPQKRFWAADAIARVTWLDGQWTFERANHVVKATSTSTITAGSTGTANVYLNGAVAYSVTVHYEWIDAAGNIASGRELLIQWFDDVGQWHVVGGECGT